MENNKNASSDEKTLVDMPEDEKTIVPAANGQPEQVISKKTAFMAGGGILTGGMAGMAFSGKQTEIQADTNGDNLPDTVFSDADGDGLYQPAANTESPSSPAAGAQPSSEGCRPWDPHTAPMAQEGTVTDQMSFSQAFASAREELGAGGVFAWHGQYYSTFYEAEVDANHQPVIDYPTVASHDLPAIPYQPGGGNLAEGGNGNQNNGENSGGGGSPQDSGGGENQNTGGNAQNTTGGGGSPAAEPAVMGLDTDQDGDPDAVFVDINWDGSADAVYSDANQDGQITDNEVEFIHDPESLAYPTGGGSYGASVMTVDINGDGIDDVALHDTDQNQIADASEAIVGGSGNNQAGTGGTPVNTVVYEGEVSEDMPDDVPDAALDQHLGDVAGMGDDFQDAGNWT